MTEGVSLFEFSLCFTKHYVHSSGTDAFDLEDEEKPPVLGKRSLSWRQSVSKLPKNLCIRPGRLVRIMKRPCDPSRTTNQLLSRP